MTDSRRPGCESTRVIRHGFTIIELLVVVFIIGLLTALLLPAVQAAREASRRIQCVNNLHQLGLAIANYQMVSGVMPPAFGANGLSPHARILPFMESQVLFASVNLNIDEGAAGNETVRRIQIHTFLCPSDSRASATSSWTNYSANVGDGFQRYGYNGAFSPLTLSLAAANFTDGLSNTASMAEIILGDMVGADPRRVVYSTPSLTRPDQFDEFARICQGYSGYTPLGSVDRGLGWLGGEPGSTLYNHILNINENSCKNDVLSSVGAWSAGSQHPGGANVLFADGRVVFLRDTISLPVWRALGSRNGGEIESTTEY